MGDVNTEMTQHSSPMEAIHASYEASNFGRFHIKLLLITFVGSVATILVTSSTAYLLPSAECDLGMDLLQKGLLNAMPFFGMLISSVVAGFLTDTFGRKIFLQMGFGGIFVTMLMGASSQSYEFLASAKFLQGVMFATSISAYVTYTSEFCHKGIRDRVMLCQASFTAIANIIAPAMAWSILTRELRISFFNGSFIINTWNVYLFAMSLWPLFACILYSTLPESPKYLVTQGRYREAKTILIGIYKENTRKAVETYPYQHLWKTEIKEEKSNKMSHKSHMSFQRHIVSGLLNVKTMFRRPMFMYLLLLSISQFLLMGKYNVTRLWFPQLSTIVEHDTISERQDMCDILDAYTSGSKIRNINSTVPTVCIPVNSGLETYINSMIIGIASCVSYFISGALVNKLGKKTLLPTAGCICIGATFGLRWANSKTILVGLFSLDMATAQTMKSLLQLVAVDMFPTTVRSLAMSIIMSCARIGSLLGNITFPILLGMGCAVSFFTLGGVIICVTFISVFLPSRNGTRS